MECKVRLHINGRIEEKKVQPGINLLEFLRNNSVEVASPCGGNGTCGKCRIRVKGLEEEAHGKELHLLGEGAVKEGYRLACYATIRKDIDIYPEEKETRAAIITEGHRKEFKLEPIVEKKLVELPLPDIQDQRGDLERVWEYNREKHCRLNLKQIRKLPELLRAHNFHSTFILSEDSLIGIEQGDTTGSLYGMAVDIGTTTIAAYLLNLNTGREESVYSCMNPQRKYGADVISRINHTMERPKGLQEMNETIVSCMNEIAEMLSQKAGINIQDIYAAVFVGNTTMTHLLMGLPPRHIASAPFIPVTTGVQRLTPEDIGLKINPQGIAVVIPSVSAYIGADTVAAVLSSGIFEDERISLLVDIGTNGEVVLGNKNWMYSCSVAAGPAFEGAQIRNGIGGIQGAIDTMNFTEGLKYTTIGGGKAVGICGSGIVDAVAGMLVRGIIDDMGRIVDADELPEDAVEEYGSRFVKLQEGSAFLILEKEACDANTDIAITQKDIRELQNAKAAVAAGIITLVNEAGIQMNDIENVYLAGGFGSYLNIDSSLTIGLLPGVLKGKIKAIGNAAGAGAVEALLSCRAITAACRIREIMKYVELSSNKDFVEKYVNSMGFSEI
jgi:uncharacterized 2Fe-2S/4Fe-4S cluster protein (DUF4445 family)